MKRTYDVKVFGAAEVKEAFIPVQQKASPPRTVFTFSKAGSLERSFDLKSPGVTAKVPAYSSIKAAVNMFMIHYTNMLRDQGFKVNTSCPGYIGTDLNSHRGIRTIDEGAANLVRPAILDKDGEAGAFSISQGPRPW